MLTSQQIDTISGIVQNYNHYVVYYYGDYVDFEYGTERDYQIHIFAGDDITFEDNTFFFGEDVQSLVLTENKYLTEVSLPGSFLIRDNELVYTDLVDSYPSLCYIPTKINNFDTDNLIVGSVLTIFSIAILIKFFFGGK